MLDRKQLMENNLRARTPKEKKKPKPIAKVGKKKQAQLDAEKELRGTDDTLMEQYYQRQRKVMTGTCVCGCGQPSQKNDDMYFRASICHLFPKRLFLSIMYHKDNWLELRFWGGCHTNFDEGGMGKWPNTACWDAIKEKFHTLAPLLTDEERAYKFYSQLEKLIYER